MEELIVLEQGDFQILAAAIGLKDIYGIMPMEDISVLDRENCLYMIHDMVEKGILEQIPSGFSIREPYRSVMLGLKEAKTIIAAEVQDGSGSVFYVGDRVVCLEESMQDADAVRIGNYELEDLYKILEEKGFLPDPYMEEDLAGLQTEKEFREWLDDGEEKAYVLRYSIFDGSKKRLAVLSLIDNPSNYWIIWDKPNEKQFLRYGKESLYSLICTYAGGEENDLS